ncbi:MAG: aconitase family protein [Hyphomonadaceae bacterium]
MKRPRTLYDKIVDAHVVRPLDAEGAQVLLYIDRTVLNEYTSPQAFSGLREAGRRVWRPSAALGVVDHVNSTAAARTARMPDAGGQAQTDYFARNCADFGIDLFDILHPMQGIEHVVMPDVGAIQPGMVIAAGDSHTTTYGAFGALGFGIGASDIEHYLATQTLIYRRLETMRVTVGGRTPLGVGQGHHHGADPSHRPPGAAGYAIEFRGEASRRCRSRPHDRLQHGGGMRRAPALIAPDPKVFDYIEGRPRAPKGDLWRRAVAAWASLRSDEEARFDEFS